MIKTGNSLRWVGFNPYRALQPWARVTKALLQMAVGTGLIVTLTVAIFHHKEPLSPEFILGRVSLALALSTGIELGYTLFTDGPDEILDPAMMAVSAGIILLVSEVDATRWSEAAALLLLGALLAILYVVRRYLADEVDQRWPGEPPPGLASRVLSSELPGETSSTSDVGIQTTGVRLRSEGPGSRAGLIAMGDDPLWGVDRAALVLAVGAGGIGVALSDGNWGSLSTFAGGLLGVMVIAFHRPAPNFRCLRTWLIRIAFGLALALCLYLLMAWPLDALFHHLRLETGYWAEISLVGLGVILAVTEPQLMRAIDRERAPRATRSTSR